MASWMVHLRIADLLIDKFKTIEKTEFVVGNIAPDSGVPNEDWSHYTPSSHVSHFKNEKGEIQIGVYVDQYFTKELQRKYTQKEYSFYLGYLTHLITDVLWREQIAKPCRQLHKEESDADPLAFLWKMKADWYDLDFLFLSKNPEFRAYQIYKNAVGFQNAYLDIFAKDAFDNRRNHIINFYHEKRDNLDRDYPLLNEKRMDQFVAETAEALCQEGELQNFHMSFC